MTYACISVVGFIMMSVILVHTYSSIEKSTPVVGVQRVCVVCVGCWCLVIRGLHCLTFIKGPLATPL